MSDIRALMLPVSPKRRAEKIAEWKAERRSDTRKGRRPARCLGGFIIPFRKATQSCSIATAYASPRWVEVARAPGSSLVHAIRSW